MKGFDINMDIIVGKTAGFCYGVDNAVAKTIKTLEDNKENVTYCLGELVHNKQVVQKLEALGLKVIEDVNELSKTTNKNDKVIIRAHGVSKQVYDKIDELGYETVDLTCPNVLAIHKIVKSFMEKGYYIFLIGQRNHPEVIGTYGWCINGNGTTGNTQSWCKNAPKGTDNIDENSATNCSIIETEEDINIEIEKFNNSNFKNLLIVGQTTFSLEKFNNFVDVIKNKTSRNIEVRNTICNATRLRQEEVEKIAKAVPFMIIIGGKNSSNTKKLYEIADKFTETVCVETVEELDLDNVRKYSKIGIMAGASTPNESIEAVKNGI